jgi:hypothetical protein
VAGENKRQQKQKEKKKANQDTNKFTEMTKYNGARSTAKEKVRHDS